MTKHVYSKKLKACANNRNYNASFISINLVFTFHTGKISKSIKFSEFSLLMIIASINQIYHNASFSR